ncbi:MAG: hypothetical protein AAGJ31_07630 [Verrucomicrobiota bacterium]
MIPISALIGCSLLFANLLPLHAGGESAKIVRVKYEEYDPRKPLRTADPMISFERKHLLYGAITSEDYFARAGKYYTIIWKCKERSAYDVVVRFEYITAKTGAEIHVQEIVPEKLRMTNTTDFQVIGEEWEEKGQVIAWKASILRAGEVVDVSRSYLWKD